MVGFRIAVKILGVIHALFVAMTALAGAFADGGDIWQRLVVVLLHPASAGGLLVLVFARRLSRTTTLAIAALLLVTVTADLAFALAMGAGTHEGRLGTRVDLLGGSRHGHWLRTEPPPGRPSGGRLRPRLGPANSALLVARVRGDGNSRGMRPGTLSCGPRLASGLEIVQGCHRSLSGGC